VKKESEKDSTAGPTIEKKEGLSQGILCRPLLMRKSPGTLLDNCAEVEALAPSESADVEVANVGRESAGT